MISFSRHFLYFFMLGLSVLLPSFAFSDDVVEKLENQIETNERAVEDLDAKIEEDREKLQELEGEKDSLSKALLNLKYSENKLSRDIFKTDSQINETEKELSELETEIQRLENEIEAREFFISESVKEIAQQESRGFWEIFLAFDTFSEFLDGVINLQTISSLLKNQSDQLAFSQDDLSGKKEIQFGKKAELENLSEELVDQKKIVEIAKQEKDTLLRQTQSIEENYQQSLAEKLELKQQFQSLLLELESQLQIAISEDSFPSDRIGLFDWPVRGYRITQFFGNTDFARTAYNGRGHSGVDFATPIGTPVRAVMDGTVIGVGNTDEFGAYNASGRWQKCVSYGGWFVIKHDNGLATLGAHLSLTKVKVGDKVERGDIVAYTGNTGFSTGPHLHFSTYAAEGVTFRKLGGTYCNGAEIPIIALNAYLDPFAYLPRPYYKLTPVQFGENSGAVRNLQNMLKHERIFPIGVSSNGQYGPTTAAAVLEWQKKYGVAANSILEQKEGRIFNTDSIDRYERLFE